MRAAVGLPQIGSDVEAVVRAACDAEDAGAWGVWLFDNLAPLRRPDGPALEGWSLLGLLSKRTSRVKLISLVTRAGVRHPALVARMAAVVQEASGGRLVLGLGAGDRASRREEDRFGIHAPRERAGRMAAIEETVRRVRSDELPVRPAVQPPPVWIGGRSPEIVRLAARVADAWHGWGLGAGEFADRAAEAGGIECWWGGMFDGGDRLDELRAAGAAGVTWMIASRRDAELRPRLLDLVRGMSG